MLEEEKKEINKWLKAKYPEVFEEGALEKLSKKVEEKEKRFKKSVEEVAEKIREKERPVVIETDVTAHLIQRIDHYLYKKWPDVFVEEGFREFKKNLEDKYNEVIHSYNEFIHSKNLINARYQEWEKSQERKVNEVREILSRIEAKISALESGNPDKKWWKFWKRPAEAVKAKDDEENQD